MDPVLAYRGACHNLAAVLYRAKAYEQAMPLFERAIAYKFLSPYLARCFAGCVWKVTHDKGAVSDFIRKANPIFGGKPGWWRTVPELEEVVDTMTEELK